MKATFALVLILILGTVVSLFLPWWTIAIVCFAVALTFLDTGKEAAFIGFLSVFLIWGIAAVIRSYDNDFLLLNRMAELLPLHNNILIILLTAVLGGLIGMLSAMSGLFLQTINKKKTRKSKYYV